ncbi:hypothetical protein R1flu_008545 [Riccia fluitans]|uniref:Uncharacterized protein n=1 Tax=Riccia fluitans TaxID=41844 RepID=A0ABD1YC79_9MARC
MFECAFSTRQGRGRQEDRGHRRIREIDQLGIPRIFPSFLREFRSVNRLIRLRGTSLSIRIYAGSDILGKGDQYSRLFACTLDSNRPKSEPERFGGGVESLPQHSPDKSGVLGVEMRVPDEFPPTIPDNSLVIKPPFAVDFFRPGSLWLGDFVEYGCRSVEMQDRILFFQLHPPARWPRDALPCERQGKPLALPSLLSKLMVLEPRRCLLAVSNRPSFCQRRGTVVTPKALRSAMINFKFWFARLSLCIVRETKSRRVK